MARSLILPQLGVCIEMNASPLWLDLDWRLLRRAKELGSKMPICPDTHATAGIKEMRSGLTMARKGWLEPEDVPNTLLTKALLAFFKGQHERRLAKR